MILELKKVHNREFNNREFNNWLSSYGIYYEYNSFNNIGSYRNKDGYMLCDHTMAFKGLDWLRVVKKIEYTLTARACSSSSSLFEEVKLIIEEVQYG